MKRIEFQTGFDRMLAWFKNQSGRSSKTARTHQLELKLLMQTHESNRLAFTLIELLVVMAIISILASLLLPTLARSKERALVTTCLNNLRQIGIATKIWNDDHDGRFPAATVDNGAGLQMSTQESIGGFDPLPVFNLAFLPAKARPLFNYISPSAVFKCPADKGQPDVSPPSRLLPEDKIRLWRFRPTGVLQDAVITITRAD